MLRRVFGINGDAHFAGDYRSPKPYLVLANLMEDRELLLFWSEFPVGVNPHITRFGSHLISTSSPCIEDIVTEYDFIRETCHVEILNSDRRGFLNLGIIHLPLHYFQLAIGNDEAKYSNDQDCSSKGGHYYRGPRGTATGAILWEV